MDILFTDVTRGTQKMIVKQGGMYYRLSADVSEMTTSSVGSDNLFTLLTLNSDIEDVFNYDIMTPQGVEELIKSLVERGRLTKYTYGYYTYYTLPFILEMNRMLVDWILRDDDLFNDLTVDGVENMEMYNAIRKNPERLFVNPYEVTINIHDRKVTTELSVYYFDGEKKTDLELYDFLSLSFEYIETKHKKAYSFIQDAIQKASNVVAEPDFVRFSVIDEFCIKAFKTPGDNYDFDMNDFFPEVLIGNEFTGKYMIEEVQSK